jgi:hypothetical protein
MQAIEPAAGAIDLCNQRACRGFMRFLFYAGTQSAPNPPNPPGWWRIPTLERNPVKPLR